jgi:cell division protein FtsL
MNKIYKIIQYILPISLFLLIFTQIVIANQMAGYGNKIGDIENKIEKLSDENQILIQQLAKAKSLTVIQDKAKEYGLTSVPNAVTVIFDQSVAWRPTK